jgi:hypothetical protein
LKRPFKRFSRQPFARRPPSLPLDNDAMSHLQLQIVTDGVTHSYVTQESLPDGTLGTLRTLRRMAAVVRSDTLSERVGRIVKGDILRGARPHDDEDERRHAFDFWRVSVQWRRDPKGVERIADTLTTHRLKWGDCGAKSIGLAATFAHFGHTPYFIFMAQQPLHPLTNEYDFNHVYCAIFAGGKRIAYDPTPERAVEAWEAQATARFGYRIFPEKGKPEVWRIE